MLTNINHYDLLECNPDDSEDEIKRKYHDKIQKLSSQNIIDLEPYHTAYYCLTDPERRKRYDRINHITRLHHIPLPLKMLAYIGRLLLTIMDCLAQFCKPLIILNLLFVLFMIFYKRYDYYLYMPAEQPYGGIYIILNNIYSALPAHDELTVMLILISFLCCMMIFLQPTIRKYNRKLKLFLQNKA